MYALFTNYLEPISFFVYGIAAIVYYRSRKSLPVLILLLYYVAAVGLMTYASSTVFTQQPNVWAYNLLLLLSGIALSLYFRHVFTTKLKKQMALLLMVLHALVCLLHTATPGNALKLNSYGFALLSLTVVMLGFMYFQQVINAVDKSEIYHRYEFWFIAGFILYHLGSFSIVLTYNYLTSEALSGNRYESRQLLTLFWGVHNVLLFLSSLLTLIGVLWISYRKRSSY